MWRRTLGDKGEKLAQKYLKENKYKIIMLNYTCSSGEIDIIAQHGEIIVFVEVRSKSNCQYGLPSETIDEKKQNKIKRAAQHYLVTYGQEQRYCRFDVVSIIWENKQPSITLFQDAF